jgi:hypothetical protein
MDNDDAQVGYMLGRREVLTLLGGASFGLLVGCSGDDADGTATPGGAHPLDPKSDE